jgi:hypothetical protein
MSPSGESSITTTAKTHVLMCKHSERTCKRQKVNNVWQPASNKQFSYYTIITWAPSCLGCKPISELGMLLLAKKERFQYKKPKSPPTKNFQEYYTTATMVNSHSKSLSKRCQAIPFIKVGTDSFIILYCTAINMSIPESYSKLSTDQ